jgi:hypothetical protein
MKQTLTLVFIFAMILALGCTKDTTAGTENTQGIVKGRVTDTKGNGLPGIQVVIEHTVLYAKYVYATTDAQGYYKTSVPEGSWRASVQIQKQFLNRTYNFELSPDNHSEFSGKAGAVRNFTWKLSGTKPNGSGFYGSNIAVYNEPGSALDMSDVAITLTPDGPLVDGSMGTAITSKLTDIGGGEDGIRDVPIGIYIITAKNTATGQPLQIRLRNTGAYGSSVTGTFTSGFTGINTYQIVVQVQ